MNTRISLNSLSTKQITPLIVIASFLMAFLVYKICYLSVPYFWDESWVYGPALSEMGNRLPSLLPGSIDIDMSRGHPMLFHFLGGLWGNIFGVSVSSLHLFSLIISSILVFHLARITSKQLTPNRILASFLSAVLLCCQGVFLAQSAMVLPEVLVSLFVLAAIYYWSQERYILSAVLIALCLLTKESGAVLYPSLGLAFLGHQLLIKDFSWKSSLKILSFLILALLPYIAFLIYQNAEFGWYFYPNHMDLQVETAQQFRNQLRATLNFLLFAQNRAYLTLFTIGILAYRFKKSRIFWAWSAWSLLVGFIIYGTQWNSWSMVLFFIIGSLVSGIFMAYASRAYYVKSNYIFLVILIFAITYLLFTAFNFFSARYLLCLFPLYILTIVKISAPLLDRLWVQLSYLLMVFLLLIPGLSRNPISDTTQSYINVGQAQKALVEYLEANHQEDIILAPFLVLESLKKDYAGYKSKGSEFINLEYSPKKGMPYLSIVSPIEGEYNVKSRPEGYEVERLRRFEKSNIYFEIKRYYPTGEW